LVFCEAGRGVERSTTGWRPGVATSVSHRSLRAGRAPPGPSGPSPRPRLRDRGHQRPGAGHRSGRPRPGPQVDPPQARSRSFLQRMGRTGRRAGPGPKCTLLAPKKLAWSGPPVVRDVYGRPVRRAATPQPERFNIHGPAGPGLALQERGTAGRLDGRVGQVPSLPRPGRAVVERILAGMLDRQVLGTSRAPWLGREGQARVRPQELPGAALQSLGAALFAVLHGRHVLGSVDESTFSVVAMTEPPVLLMAGRAWRKSPPGLEGRGPRRNRPRTRAGRGGGAAASSGRQPCSSIRGVLGRRRGKAVCRGAARGGGWKRYAGRCALVPATGRRLLAAR